MGSSKSQYKSSVIGVDLSLVGTGFVALGDNKIICRELIKSKKGGDLPIDETKRLMGIIDKTIELTVKIQPELVAIEGLAFMARNSTALTQLSGLHHMLREALLTVGIPFVIVAPTTLKKFATCKGNAPKDLMLMEVYKRYGVTFTDDNLCDAFVLAKVAQALVTGDKVTKIQQEVIKLLSKQI